MRSAAIYARKSTPQPGADLDATSNALQIENGRAFAAARDWTVSDAYVYADEAVSGADIKKLVQRERLLATIRAGAPFQILIMRDASRFSRRDGDEAFGELKAIAQAGIEIWFYQDGTRFEYGTFSANITGIMKAEFNREHCRQTSTLVKAKHTREVLAGTRSGARVWYSNVKVGGHMERRIVPQEADVVRQIFDHRAAGGGYARIAKTLNSAGAVCPRPQSGRPAGWSPSTILEILRRPLYRGQVIWNRTKKRNMAGQTAPTRRPPAEWLHVEKPELRIVTDEPWDAAQARIRTGTVVATATGAHPVVRRDADSKYLLSGFLRCAICGGSVSVVSRPHGKKRAHFYGCLAHNKRGAAVCGNALVLPVERLDTAVLRAIAGDVLQPTVIIAIVEAVFEAL